MDYDAILHRLAAYRKECNLRQHEMAKDLHMTQSQYSKVESGKIKLSYDNLCVLQQKGCDIDLLITGETKPEILPCLKKLALVEDEERFANLMKLCVWAWEQWEKEGDIPSGIGNQLLKLWVSLDGYKRPQWERLRKAYFDISQMNMANEIGVNIKKYRLLERENVKPDAELMLNIYDMTECRPQYFMDEKGYYLSLISEACIENQRREEQLESILKIVNQFEELSH